MSEGVGGGPDGQPLPEGGTTCSEAVSESDKPAASDACSTAELVSEPTNSDKPAASDACSTTEIVSEPTGSDKPATADACSTAPTSTNGEAGAGDDEALSFQRNMSDRFEVLVHQCLEPWERVLEGVVAMLQSRAELERKYGESLVSLPDQVQMGCEPSTVQSAVEAVMVNFRNRGEQSLELAESISTDVAPPLQKLSRHQKGVFRRIQYDVQFLSKNCSDARKAHDKMAAKYGSVCLEAEEAAQSSLQGIGHLPTERAKMAGRAVELALAARAAEREYYASIEQVNKTRAEYEQHMPMVLASMQDMQEKLTEHLRDGLRKLAVYDMAWLRNLQYDLEATVKSAEESDPRKDLEDFIGRHQSGSQEPNPSSAAQVALPFWQLLAPPKSGGERDAGRGPAQFSALQANVLPWWQMVKDRVQTTVQTGEKPKADREAAEREAAERDATVRQLIDTEFRPMAQALVSEEPDVGCSQEVTDSAEAQIPRMEELPRRAAMCYAFRTEVVSREAPGTELDAAAHLQLPRANFDIIERMFTSALTACESQNDSWTGRDLLVLSQLFLTGGDPKPVRLLSRLYNHPIWNKVSFWDDVLFVGLCEAHSSEAIWRRSLPPGSQFVSPSMTTFLQRYVGYMTEFGVKEDQVRISVEATLKKHSPLLGPSTGTYLKLLFEGHEAKQVDPLISARGPPPARGSSLGGAGEAEATNCRPDSGSPQGDDAAGDPAPRTTDPAPDDFEALGLGLLEPDGGQNDFAQSGDDLGSDPALEAMTAQLPTDDVFA